MAIVEFKPFDMGNALRQLALMEQVNQGRQQGDLARRKFEREIAQQNMLREIMSRYGGDGSPPALNAIGMMSAPEAVPYGGATGGPLDVPPEPVPYRGGPLDLVEAPHDGRPLQMEPIPNYQPPQQQPRRAQGRQDQAALIAELRRNGFWEQAGALEKSQREGAQADLARQQQLVEMIGKATDDVAMDPRRWPTWRRFLEGAHGLEGLPETADEFVSKSRQTFAQSKARADTVEGKIEVARGSREPDRTLVEVADPSSPTGRRMVPRAQAIGMPAPAPSALVNVDQKGETEESKAVGKWAGETYTKLQDAGVAADRSIARLDRLDQVLDQVDTGALAGTAQAIKANAKALGVDLEALGIKDDVGPAQMAAALANEMALELRNPAGGAGMPGALSDKDREFLVSMVPGISQTAEGRKLLIGARRKLYQRDKDVSRLAREYRQQHGRLDEGFYSHLSAWSEANPLFPDSAMGAAETARLPTPKTPEEMQALPSGTRFTAPDGSVRVKP